MKKQYFTWVLIFMAKLAFSQSFETTVLKAKGNCLETKISLFNADLLDYLSVKTYDAKGNLTKNAETFSAKLNGPYTTENTYEYDAKNNNTKVIFKQNGIQKSVILKEYDVAGKLTKETLSNAANVNLATASLTETLTQNAVEKTFGNANGKETKAFDKAGNLLKQETFDGNGKLTSSLSSDYDAKGNHTKNTRFDAAANVSEVTTLTYEANGNLLNEKTLRNQEVFSETIYDYLKNNLSKKTHKNRYSQVDYYFTFEYDAAGNLVKQSYFGNNQLVNSTSFEYDNRGNKTKESYFDKTGKLTGYKAWEYSCK